MSNPFTFGTVVLGKDFANRQKELTELTRRLKGTVRIFVVAPRRYGKTSLIKNVLGRLQRQGVLTAYLDLYWANSSKEFIELWMTNVLSGSRSVARRAVRFVRDFLPRLRPKISFGPNGKPEVSLDLTHKVPFEAVEEVLHLPQRLAQAEKKHFVVVLDEFQEIFRFDGDSLERQIRAAIQEHTKVGYLFAGSKTSVLVDMVSDQTRPFYQMGTLMSLEKIPEEEFKTFINAKFASSGKKISSAALARIIEECENVPHYVQLLCFNLWDHFQADFCQRKGNIDIHFGITAVCDPDP